MKMENGEEGRGSRCIRYRQVLEIVPCESAGAVLFSRLGRSDSKLNEAIRIGSAARCRLRVNAVSY